MREKPLTAIRIVLDFRSVDASETVRKDLNDAITTMAPSSPMWANQVVKDEVANLGKTLVTYHDASTAAVKSGTQHKLDLETEATAKADNNRCINVLRTLVESGALTPGDVKGMGFVPYEGPPAKPPLVAPVHILVELSKKSHGKAKVSVYEIGTTRRHYAAQWSLNGIDGWADLVGHGKSRRLNGKTGTSIWVRFALELGALRSEWSIPVKVDFP